MEKITDRYKVQCYVSKEVYDTIKMYCHKTGMTMSAFGAMQLGNSAMAIDKTIEILTGEILSNLSNGGNRK